MGSGGCRRPMLPTRGRARVTPGACLLILLGASSMNMAAASADSPPPPVDASRLLSVRDKDGDSHLSMGEVFAGGERRGILKKQDALYKQANSAFSFIDDDADGLLSRSELSAVRRRFFKSKLSKLTGKEFIQWLANPKCMPKGCRACPGISEAVRKSKTPLPGLALWDYAIRSPERLREVGLHTEIEQATVQLAVLLEIEGQGCLEGGGGGWWGYVLVVCCLVSLSLGVGMGLGSWGVWGGGEHNSLYVEKGYAADSLAMPESARSRASKKYKGQSRQIALKKDAQVTVLDPPDLVQSATGYEGWVYGKSDGREGWFPLSFCTSTSPGTAVQSAVQSLRKTRSAMMASGRPLVEKRWTWPVKDSRGKKVTFYEDAWGGGGLPSEGLLWALVVNFSVGAMVVHASAANGLLEAVRGFDAVLCAASVALACCAMYARHQSLSRFAWMELLKTK